MTQRTPRSIRKCKMFRLLYFFVMIVFLLTSIQPAHALVEKKRVLFISSYSQEFLSIPEQIKGIEEVFEDTDISLSIEYMDTKRLDTQENRELFYELLAYKLKNLPPYEAVIVGDDNALEFAMIHGEDLFGDLPMVFLGINDVQRAIAAHDSGRFTGVIEVAPLKENVELALRFNPHATKVVAIVDNSYTGIGDTEQFYKIASDFPQLTFSDINASKLNSNELRIALSSITDDTIVLYLSFYRDYKGQNITIDQSVDLISQYVKVPIYRQSIGGVGSGVLGGKMVSFQESGRIAADMIIQLLSGKTIADIPMILESPNFYVFDYNLLKEYKIHESLVPENAILINQPYSFYRENKEFVNVLLAMMATFAIISVMVFLDNLKYRRTQKQLKESMEKLEEANDELVVSEEEIRTQYQTIQERIDDIELLNQKFEIAVESTSSAVFELSLNGQELYLSKSFAKIVDEPVFGNVLSTKVAQTYLDPGNYEALLEEFNRYRTGLIPEIDIQLPLRLRNEEEKWILIKGKEVKDTHGYSKMIHGIILDMTKVKDQERHIYHLAYHDHLTNLPNRTRFQTYLQELMDKSIPCAVMILDIDNFKTVNDTLGHTYGDMLLQEMAKRLLRIELPGLFVSRFGGDEFLILYENPTSYEKMDDCLAKIDAALEEDFCLSGHCVHLQYTIGISCYPKDGNSIDEMITNSDTALYQAKRTGKNQKMFYVSEMKQQLYERTEIEQALRQALAEDGFTLVYQPQVNVCTGQIDNFEALLRMKHHTYSPLQFIEVAEEVGLIIDIGRWVTKQVVAQLATWREKGFQLKPISINFSSKQIFDTKYPDFLEKLLCESSIDPKYLEIEITESILLEKSEQSLEYLVQLRNIGVSLSLDDFGTGYSSINYLTFIPVDKVKLDKSLSDRFLEIEDDKIINSIISLVHSLDLTITCEGIEHSSQFDRLVESGCDFVQGYLFARPLPVAEVEKIYNMNLIERMKQQQMIASS